MINNLKKMTSHQVQTNLPPITKGVNPNMNTNQKQNPFDTLNFEMPISQNSTKNSASISQNQNRSQDIQKQVKPVVQQTQQANGFSNKNSQKKDSINISKVKNEVNNLPGKYNIQSQEFQRDDENQLSPQLNRDHQAFAEIRQNMDSNFQENNIKEIYSKDKQVKQPFIPYKYRKSSNPSVNASNFDQNNFYYNTKGYLQSENNSYATDCIVNYSDDGEISKEEYRDPILNVQKHRKEFGINIAQKMNRFYNIKALTNKSQQLQLAFDNANNLFIVDQRDDNYLSQTVMNLNMDMSTRKHQSQDILQQIIQEKRNSIAQGEGLCHSITTNGKESLLSQLSKKSQLKTQMQMNTQGSFMKPKYMLYHNSNSNQISPKSNLNAQIINSPISISSNSNNQNVNYPKNYNAGFSTSVFKTNINHFGMPKNSNNFQNTPSPPSQFDKFAFKKPEIPLVNTRKALFKYTNNNKKLVKSNTEGNFSSSQNYKSQSQYSHENLKTNTDAGYFQKLNDLFHNQQLSACQQFNQPQIMTAKNQLKQQPQKIDLFSKSCLQTQNKPYFEQDINLSESLKTWKVKQFNDDFNKISKELKKSYYRGQLNNKFDSKNQTAYFTTNGMYGFFCSKNEEVARDSGQDNQEKSKIEEEKREGSQNQRQQTQDKNIDSEINQVNSFQTEIQSSKTPRKQNYNNLKELVLQKEEVKQQQNVQPNEVEVQNEEQQVVRQNEFAVETEPTKKNDDIQQESQGQADSLKINLKKNNLEVVKKDMSNIKTNFNKNIQDFMIGNIKQNNQKQANEKKGSNTAREIYQNTSEDDEITGWISRKKSDTLFQHRPSFSSYHQSKTSIQFRKNINASNTNSITYNSQQESYKNIFGSNFKITSPKSQNGANSFQSIPKSNQSNNNIQNSQHSIGASSNNQTREQNNHHKDPNLISKITEHGESQDYSLDNSNFIQNRMAGFITRDKNDDDEDLKNYLHLQNIIPSQIK
ncbi:hypothetical protein TTHERM_00128840 (macronuclear) [Tetrahymena thermophila SB210]|uniref:Uncharacterized protein n=1 Tax=Tetrahymena thermophila (strain SB210) TaxID=312017 RepID=I7M7W2_TETTS|nr:hypothetical protein TTHERM_00128840 [Tetrahymena thermophila SB210]EAR96120.2 hypothetical protein TTHERM_00128840 [Tetrahymena thermophila SB210]|eukprot:XP_001016365.2 hypothetical protein TTHERM_00128840 [Tetrahymena thermophila SB210]